MIVTEFKKEGQTLGVIVAETKEFSSGSRGFYGNGKLVIGDKKYQVNVQIIEIGSKPTAPVVKKSK